MPESIIEEGGKRYRVSKYHVFKDGKWTTESRRAQIIRARVSDEPPAPKPAEAKAPAKA